MKKNKVVVTGLGAIASNGRNVAEFFQNCRNGQRGLHIAPQPVFDTSGLCTPYWGQAPLSREKSLSRDNGEETLIHRAGYLAETAAEEALRDACLTKQDVASLGNRAALITGSLSYDDYHILETVKSENVGRDYLLHMSNPATQIKEYCGVSGACYNLSSACSSGTAAIGIAMELLQTGQLDVALVCGIDSLSQMVAYGFHSLKALSSALCHPLDADRDGINIGEGCGFLVLETVSHARQRNKKAYAECVGYSIGNEAFHITSPDTEATGFLRSMKTALNNAALSPETIDYVNLHGTGTVSNDEVELQALQQLYPDGVRRPYVSSLKTLIGHCMGAAGALEAILTVLCLHDQYYFPIFEVTKPMKEMESFSLTPPADGTPMHYAMSNSFAFAGNTASVILKQGEPDTEHTADPVSVHPVWINGLGMLAPGIPNLASLSHLLQGDAPDKENLAPTPTPGIPAKKLRGVNHLSRMVLSTALQAEKDSGCDHVTWDPERVGTFYSSGYGAITERLEFGKKVAEKQPDLCNPTVFANISPNAPLGHLCINLNCKGASTSLHGASPLLMSALPLQNGSCDVVLSCMAEEYDPLLAEELSHQESTCPYLYQESSITLLLQNKQTEHSYCQIKRIITHDIRNMEQIETISEHVGLIFMQDARIDLRQRERALLHGKYPDSLLLSAASLTGQFHNNSLYANLALAALCLREQTLPEIFTDIVPAEHTNAFSSVLVTGYDVCENYHHILLCTADS